MQHVRVIAHEWKIDELVNDALFAKINQREVEFVGNCPCRQIAGNHIEVDPVQFHFLTGYAGINLIHKETVSAIREQVPGIKIYAA